MPKRLSLSRLAEMAVERESLKQQIAKLQNDYQDIDAKIIEEMTNRNTHMIETNGVRIVKTVAQRTVVDWDAIGATLTRAQAELASKKIWDKALLEAAVKARQIPANKVTPHISIKDNAPYLTISATAPS